MPQDDPKGFRSWYRRWAQKLGLDSNPDDPRHHYDYRAAYLAGAEPTEESGWHWPSTYKDIGHPNRFVDGIDTKTGMPLSPPAAARDATELNPKLAGPNDFGPGPEEILWGAVTTPFYERLPEDKQNVIDKALKVAATIAPGVGDVGGWVARNVGPADIPDILGGIGLLYGGWKILARDALENAATTGRTLRVPGRSIWPGPRARALIGPVEEGMLPRASGVPPHGGPISLTPVEEAANRVGYREYMASISDDELLKRYQSGAYSNAELREYGDELSRRGMSRRIPGPDNPHTLALQNADQWPGITEQIIHNQKLGNVISRATPAGYQRDIGRTFRAGDDFLQDYWRAKDYTPDEYDQLLQLARQRKALIDEAGQIGGDIGAERTPEQVRQATRLHNSANRYHEQMMAILDEGGTYKGDQAYIENSLRSLKSADEEAANVFDMRSIGNFTPSEWGRLVRTKEGMEAVNRRIRALDAEDLLKSINEGDLMTPIDKAIFDIQKETAQLASIEGAIPHIAEDSGLNRLRDLVSRYTGPDRLELTMDTERLQRIRLRLEHLSNRIDAGEELPKDLADKYGDLWDEYDRLSNDIFKRLRGGE